MAAFSGQGWSASIMILEDSEETGFVADTETSLVKGQGKCHRQFPTM